MSVANLPVCKPLPPGWRWARLGEVCKQDRQIVEPNSEDAAELTYYSLEHIESGTGRLLKNPEEQIEDEGKSTTFRFDARHVLYGKLRPYLNKVALPDRYGRCTTELIPLLPLGNACRDFLGWIFRRAETVEFSMLGKTGSRMPRADMDSLLSLPIPLPPLPEQRCIAAILAEQMAAVDKARAAAQARLDALKAIPAAYLRQVFPQPGQTLPDGWRWTKLGEVCIRPTGIRDPRVNPNSAFQYVDISSVSNTHKKISNARSIIGKNAPSRARQVIRANDIIVATTRPNLNAVAQVPSDLDNQICSTGFCVLRAGDNIQTDYLFAFVQHEKFISALTDLVNGALYPAVNDCQVMDQSIPLPPFAEQRRLAAVLTEQMAAVAKARAAAQAEQQTINALPAALLRRAFSGGL